MSSINREERYFHPELFTSPHSTTYLRTCISSGSGAVEQPSRYIHIIIFFSYVEKLVVAIQR